MQEVIPVVRVLMVEQSSDDAELMLLELRRGGFEPSCERVATLEEMHAALTRGSWDVVLADNTVPDFDAMTALTLLQHSGLDLPFIVVSDAVGVEQAVQIMKAGADNYLPKENLAQLVPAVQRALQESTTRRARKAVEREAYRLATLLRSLGDAVIGLNLEGFITSWNPAAEQLYGWPAMEAVGRDISLIIPPEYTAELTDMVERLTRGERIQSLETVRIRKDGTRIDVSLTVSPIRNDDGKLIGVSKSARDITQRRRQDERQRTSESRFKCLLESNSVAMGCWTAEGSITTANDALQRLIGYSKEEVESGRVRWTDLTPPEQRGRDEKALEEIRTRGYSTPYEKEYIRKDGNRVPILIGGAAFGDGITDAGAFFAVDLSGRKKTEARQRIKRVSNIELEILKFIADGVPNKNIAVALSLSLRTVEKYRHSLFESLGVNSAAEATRIWVLANLEY